MKKILVFLFLLVAGISSAQATAGFSKIGTSSTTNFNDTTCPNQSTCYYQVTAVDSILAESSPANCGTSSLCLGGNQVVAVMPSSGVHTVALTWTASTSSGVTYNIYRHIGPLPASNLNVVVN